jgi:transposase
MRTAANERNLRSGPSVVQHVRRVVVANPVQVRLIAESRIKTDKIDAAMLAQLFTSGFLRKV